MRGGDYRNYQGGVTCVSRRDTLAEPADREPSVTIAVANTTQPFAQCPEQGPLNMPNNSSTSVGTFALNPTTHPFMAPPTSTTCNCCHTLHSSDKAVLPQTARVVVFNPAQPRRQREVTLIHDNGSQRSYVTESVRQWLLLETKSRKALSIMTFSIDSEKSQWCDVVEVGIKTRRDGNRNLTLLTTPLICEPINRTLNEKWLQNIRESQHTGKSRYGPSRPPL